MRLLPAACGWFRSRQRRAYRRFQLSVRWPGLRRVSSLPACESRGPLRIAEDFKLSTGTWVNVGDLRSRILQNGGKLVRDIVVAGHDRDYLSALIFPDQDECRGVCPELPIDASPGVIYSSPEVRKRFEELLDSLNREGPASARRIGRALLVEESPSIDANEITEKGTLNQRAVLERRAALVEELYSEPLSPRVIVAAALDRDHRGKL